MNRVQAWEQAANPFKGLPLGAPGCNTRIIQEVKYNLICHLKFLNGNDVNASQSEKNWRHLL